MNMNNINCIIIGGSAGCGILFQSILSSIPKDFVIPIIFVRHVKHDDLNNDYMKVLSERYSLSIQEPEDKDKIKNSTIYFAPPGYHLMIESEKSFSLNLDPKVNFSRPSIDVLFESAAHIYKSTLVGVLLSGSNSDGTKGLKLIKEYGGISIVQDPLEAEFDYMPKSAISNNAFNFKYSIDKIIATIIELNKNAKYRSEH